ncbi:TPR-like protein [Cryphonectria parasitica EP155]|uniref:TPR-like protein n=1 Tax=Cryphonectria parasitica (strain ATCC 38755 / EP155) TaxID=660469 RepID=A0A9P4Y098_CRYP1|nr:TPR-like protein [Cryphonectria parasitica EP155]KAF3763770.1 TPR-like protein [Cryphonectria parasitica EP155]
MSASKAALKAINDAIKQQKFDDAIERAQDFLQKDPKNYNALVFLAFAFDKKDRLDEAEKTYEAAAKQKPSDATAWQGLVKLYERQGGKKLANYQNATIRLAESFRDSEQTYKYQKTVDDFIGFARTHGDPHQYVDALSLTLPDSPVYSAVEGRTRPAETYETIAKILEVHEKKEINTLIGERRTRIGARVNEVTVEVKREVLGGSRLGQIYREIINWSTDDDVRRHYEEKLLQHCYERLLVFPPGPQKSEELKVVLKLAGDMVIIKHPFRLAWEITIDWRDFKETKEWDAGVLRDYCNFFPDTDLCSVITAYLSSEISAFPKMEPAGDSVTKDEQVEDDSEDDDDGGAPTNVIPLTEEDRLLMMSEGVLTAQSLLSYRLVAEYYESLQEHEANVEMLRKAMALLKERQTTTGMDFQNTKDIFHLHLATALVFWQSPRHHQEAKALFDGVLARDPLSTKALIGVGLIYEEEEEYGEAVDFLERALERDPENLRVRSEAAWVKSLKGDYAASAAELERCLPLVAAKGDAFKDLLAQTQYRLGACIWNLDTSKAARKSRDPGSAYLYFLDALKSNLTFAPAYTSLGTYYADYARDTKRARRCFQKAVELSSSEIISAERLARSFANEADWDRVELVAQRIVDSGKVKPPPGSKRKGISWPFSALGVAELHKQEFHKAIASFQAALRISPDDYHSWVGLGESYYSSGRYMSATKAIQNARRLEEEQSKSIDPSEIWFTKFMLANIKRELGEFDEAIALYQDVMQGRPDEEGVAIALMQTMVDSAMNHLEKGFFGKSVTTAQDALAFAVIAPEGTKETFNFWKAVADSCAVFSSSQSRASDLPLEAIHTLLGDGEDRSEFELLKDIDRVDDTVVFARGLFPDNEKVGVDLTRAIHATILVHKRAIHAAAHDVHAQSVAFYNLGWAEHRAHVCLPENLKKKFSRYLKAAIRCFKRAIELEAGNSEFWNALGVATSQINPAVSQHAFVRSLHLNERDARAWTNLGTLGLLQNDLTIANEAFTRAQSTDPDCAHAWLGQGFVALLAHKDSKEAVREARGLFTHAMEIAESSSLASRQHYSLSMFDHVLATPSSLRVTPLIQSIFALGQLRALKPQELAYGHLCTLFQERTYDTQKSVVTLEEICSRLEGDYEVTESPQSLKRFAMAKADLARAYLATESYEKAVDCGEMALQLSSDESDNELTTEERRKTRLSAHLTVGLAYYYKKEVAQAVVYFDSALQESDNNPDAVCLLAQVLWATGSEEARERARSVLFDVVEQRPDHVQSVLLLGVIAILDQDEESLEAVISELEGLRTHEKTSPAEQFQIGGVLQSVAALSGKDAHEALLSQAQTDIMLCPHLPHGWTHLGDVADADHEYPRELAVTVANQAVPPKGELGAEDLADTYAVTGKSADAQISIMFAPWSDQAWQGLVKAVRVS